MGKGGAEPEVTAKALLPRRITERIDFNGPVPPDPYRPITTPCWLWLGWLNSAGYGYLGWERRDQPAHRVVHTLMTGEDLTGLDRDHECRVVACVRPDHGAAVPHGENIRRGSRHQKACRRAGHDYSDPRNVHVRPNGLRYCQACKRADRATAHLSALAIKSKEN